MRKIIIYAVGKKDEPCVRALVDEYVKQTARWARVEFVDIYTKKIHQAQKDPEAARKAYTEALRPYLEGGFNIALHPDAKELDSHGFAELLGRHERIHFFIGGAFGFGEEFLRLCDMRLSLSRLTFSHKVAKIVLAEQIFRGCSIINHHPYHK